VICDNEHCPSGVKTPAGCPALGSCANALPVKTVMDALRDPEVLIELLDEVWACHEPWTGWACRCCEANGLPTCDLGSCPWAGKDRELIRTWLGLPERVGLPHAEET